MVDFHFVTLLEVVVERQFSDGIVPVFEHSQRHIAFTTGTLQFEKEWYPRVVNISPEGKANDDEW